MYLGAAALVGALVGALAWAGHLRQPPKRCPAGFTRGPSRCCPAGQAEQEGTCTGIVTHCPPRFRWVDGEPGGCVHEGGQVTIPGGALALSPTDWEGDSAGVPAPTRVASFAIDVREVTQEDWRRCANLGPCRRLPWREPGLPVTGISPDEAAAYCRYAGGRLPRADEWVLAATGEVGRRYPWGGTGLVCRRAAFGLTSGPCGEGARGPELGGTRPDGATPEGVLDLAGNVAEWTLEPDGAVSARGGSFASTLASELKTWAVTAAQEPSERVGFRCVRGTDPSSSKAASPSRR